MIRKELGTTEYFVKGEHPTLLLLSGMHGDEYSVIEPLKQYIEHHEDEFPDFVFIPQVSPSAVAQKTRKNINNLDVNRNFIDPPEDPEVKNTMDIIRQYHFSWCLNFHEDPDLEHTFYLYDSGVLSVTEITNLREAIKETGAELHTGIDDPLDANLGLHVEEGYVSTPYATIPLDAGFSWTWYDKHNLVDRSVDIEIPGTAPQELKQTLVETVFSFFLSYIQS